VAHTSELSCDVELAGFAYGCCVHPLTDVPVPGSSSTMLSSFYPSYLSNLRLLAIQARLPRSTSQQVARSELETTGGEEWRRPHGEGGCLSAI
jgi:hypothetical protein